MREIRVKMPSGVSSVSVGGQEYRADDDGIVTVQHPEHVAPLVNSHGGVEVDEDGEPSHTPGLLGTDHFPVDVVIREGEDPRPLASIVAEAKERSGTTDDEWNNLPQSVRDLLIELHVAELRGEWGRVGEMRESLGEMRESVETAEKAKTEAEERVATLEDEKRQLGEALETANADKATAETAREEAVAENDRLRTDLDAATAKVTELEAAASQGGKAKKSTAES